MILFLSIAIICALFNFIFEKFNVKILWVFFFAWIFPLLISQNSDLPFNRQWGSITIYASISVVLGFYLGYLVAFIFPLNIGLVIGNSLTFKSLSSINIVIQLISFFSFSLLFILLKNFPLLSGNVLENRMLIQNINPIVWTITQLSFLSSSISSALKQNKNWSNLSILLFYIIFIFIVLAGWRNYILMYLLYFFIPYLFVKKINLIKIFFFVGAFFLFFSIIGFLRGDFGDSSLGFENVFTMIGLYIYPNFLNFETLSGEQFNYHTLYTFQFMLKPLLEFFDFNTVPPQTNINAFNVSTAMSVLYQDGGLVNIFFTTFFMGFFLRRGRSLPVKNTLDNFWRSTLIIVLIFFHNGWVLLNFMPTFITIFFIILIVTIKSLRVSK